MANTASVEISSVRRSILEVSHAVSGEPMHSITPPKVISRPASRMLTPRLADNSPSMPAGASTEQPVTKLPSINAVGAKRRVAGLSMRVHVAGIGQEGKNGMIDFARDLRPDQYNPSPHYGFHVDTCLLASALVA